MTLRVFISGGSSERRDVVRPLVDQIQAAGLVVTYDWTRDPGWYLGRPPTNAELLESSQRDLDGILRAHVLWLVVPIHKSEGSAAELGFALAHGRRIVVSGPTGPRNIFALRARAEDTFDYHEHALAHLVAMADVHQTFSTGVCTCSHITTAKT